MKYRVYIDGQAGTTGLQLRQKLEKHGGVELLLISEEKRTKRMWCSSVCQMQRQKKL